MAKDTMYSQVILQCVRMLKNLDAEVAENIAIARDVEDGVVREAGHRGGAACIGEAVASLQAACKIVVRAPQVQGSGGNTGRPFIVGEEGKDAIAGDRPIIGGRDTRIDGDAAALRTNDHVSVGVQGVGPVQGG